MWISLICCTRTLEIKKSAQTLLISFTQLLTCTNSKREKPMQIRDPETIVLVRREPMVSVSEREVYTVEKPSIQCSVLANGVSLLLKQR